MGTERGREPARVAVAAWRYVRSAPGTFVWLTILAVTTLVRHRLSPETLDEVLVNRSTNLHGLDENPLRVLLTSAFWLAGGSWASYLVLYNVFHAPVERWLGTLRWSTVVAAAHVGATYLSQGVLHLAIQHGRAPESAMYTLDFGVSYGLAGVVAVLTYRIARPWRYPYAFGVLLVYGIPLLGAVTFTDIGHFTAAVIGFACYPLTRGRPGTWNPGKWLRGARPRRILAFGRAASVRLFGIRVGGQLR